MISRRGGQAALSFVLLLGGVVAFVGVTLALFALTFVNAQGAIQAANRAHAAAASGTADALLRLARNAAFASAGYTVATGNDTATVTIVQNTPASGKAKVTAVSRVRGFVRTVETIVQASSTGGTIDLSSAQLTL